MFHIETVDVCGVELLKVSSFDAQAFHPMLVATHARKSGFIAPLTTQWDVAIWLVLRKRAKNLCNGAVVVCDSSIVPRVAFCANVAPMRTGSNVVMI